MTMNFKDQKHVIDLEREIERLSTQRELWPNFDPLSIPLAYYDGNNTYLFRYPGIPEGFTNLKDDARDILFFKGRHPTVVASSTITLSGMLVASVMMDKSFPTQTSTGLASLAIHEAFHVFQAHNHATWNADVSTLFLYPVENAQLLFFRRIETEALRRALATNNLQEKASWTRQALKARKNRYARLDTDLSTYERKGELLEGLATYVEALSIGRTNVDLPQTGYRANEVRGRFYKIGHALAVLLDTFAPTWKTEFEEDDTQALDLYLANVLDNEADRGLHSSFTQSELAKLENTAKKDAQELLQWRSERKRVFDSRTGKRVTVIASIGSPLRVNGIDPSNAVIIDGGVLHTRFVKLRHARGQIEMLSSLQNEVEVLTEAAGSHPLFSGVLKLTVVGLEEVNVKIDGGSVDVTSAELTAHFENANADKNDSEVVIHMNE